MKVSHRTDSYFSAIVDVGAGSCRIRSEFWRNLKEKGFDYAFARMVRVTPNAASMNAIRDYYNEHLRYREQDPG